MEARERRELACIRRFVACFAAPPADLLLRRRTVVSADVALNERYRYLGAHKEG